MLWFPLVPFNSNMRSEVFMTLTIQTVVICVLTSYSLCLHSVNEPTRLLVMSEKSKPKSRQIFDCAAWFSLLSPPSVRPQIWNSKSVTSVDMRPSTNETVTVSEYYYDGAGRRGSPVEKCLGNGLTGERSNICWFLNVYQLHLQQFRCGTYLTKYKQNSFWIMQ
jgi:hypothetical protein